MTIYRAYEVDTNSDGDYPSATVYTSETTTLTKRDHSDKYNTVELKSSLSYLPRNIEPIKNYKCWPVVGKKEEIAMFSGYRHTATKPLYVTALIYEYHTHTGENPNSHRTLRETIRNRGKSGDDCGHVVARSLGGKMFDVNLFPQNKDVNRGLKGNYVVWRIVEVAMWLWVKLIPQDLNPRVRFQMTLFYEDLAYLDRPTRFVYCIEFLWDKRDKNNNMDENSPLSVAETVLNCANLLLQAKNEEVEDIVRNIKRMAKSSSRSGKAANQFLEELEDIIDITIELYPKPEPSKPGRGISPWDFVPFISNIKAIKDGIDDLKEENTSGGIWNIATGTAGMALDIATLGYGGTVLAKGVKMAATSGSRKAIFEGAKVVTKAVVTRLHP